MPGKWDEEEDDSPVTSPPNEALSIPRRSKFDDEEGEDDVIDSWDAAEDSEEEREKAKKKEEADAKRAAEAAANKKSKSQRIQEHKDNAQRRAELEAELAALEKESGEDATSQRERLRNLEMEAEMDTVADLLGKATTIGTRKGNTGTLVFYQAANGEEESLDLATLSVFQPAGKPGFDEMKAKLVALVTSTAKKPHYPLFLPELFKECAKVMSSEQIKRTASTLTALANEKMKEEKAAEKGPKKKTKAATKVSVSAGPGKVGVADTTNYDNEVDDYDDFM